MIYQTLYYAPGTQQWTEEMDFIVDLYNDIGFSIRVLEQHNSYFGPQKSEPETRIYV